MPAPTIAIRPARLLGALIILATLCVTSAARAQFAPATGPVNSLLSFSSASNSTHGAFSVSRSGQTLTISRPGLGDFTYTAPGGDPNRVLSYAFVGDAGLLLKTVDANNVTVRIILDWMRMDTLPVGSLPTNIYNVQKFVTEQPNPQAFANSDGQVFFTKLFVADAAINDTFELNLYRNDTGAHLCGMMPVNRESSHTFTAEVTGTDVSITWTRPPFNPVTNACALPAADLSVSPPTLDFGEIANNTTVTMPVTLENPGTDPITIDAIGSAGPFSPVGFAPFTLDPFASQTVTIRFNPSGVTDTFNEQLPITRTPAVGDDAIHCVGEATTPVPEISVSSTSLSFGTVNVGNTGTRTFSIDNTGDLPLDVTAVTGPSLPQFTVAPPLTAPLTLAPADPPLSFTVSFAPTADAPFSDSIVLTSNDPANGTETISLSGDGHIPAPEFALDPTLTSLTYGQVEEGYRYGKGVRIVNQGDAPLTFTVEVTGDSRYSFSQTPNTPGPGGRGPTVITIPASPLSGPFNELILRCTFDAQGPAGGPYNGTLEISGINDPNATPRSIALDGDVIAGKTLDVALVIDRSGSMNEPMQVGTKVQAVRQSSRLLFELLRTDVSDRAALVQFNENASTIRALTPITAASRADFIADVNDTNNLAPQGSTSITAGLLEAFSHLGDASRQVRAALVVSDGKENMPATLADGTQVTLDTITVPNGIAVHSLALGTTANTDQVKLATISGDTGGIAQATDNVTSLGIFDVEKFFLQAATTITGGTPLLDPLLTIAPGQVQTSQVELIPADKAVTFVLLFKDGVLPWQIEAPDGTMYPAGSPPNGFGQAIHEPPNARIVRLLLPTSDPDLYRGTWKIHVSHGGKVLVGEGEDRKTRESREPVTYALAVSVNSNLRLLGLLSPQPLHPGDPILVTAFVTEEEVPVLNSTIDVTVTAPNGSTQYTLQLHDDGAHNDGAANDGEYADEFRHTNQTGAYTFFYHATGASARGGQYVRETTLSQYVVPINFDDDPKDGDGADDGGRDGEDEECCDALKRWLIIIAILIIIVILILIGLSFRQKQLVRAGQVVR